MLGWGVVAVFSTRKCPLAHPLCSEISHTCLRGWRGKGETLGLGAQDGPLKASGKPGHVRAEEGQQKVVGTSRVCAHQGKAMAS